MRKMIDAIFERFGYVPDLADARITICVEGRVVHDSYVETVENFTRLGIPCVFNLAGPCKVSLYVSRG